MNDSCITRFEISNFKKFDHLVVDNIGQVNLITGDNNVGKTTLLEALLFNEDNLRWITYLHQTLFYRGIHINPENINTDKITFPAENFLNYILKDLSRELVCKYINSLGIINEIGIRYKSIEQLNERELLCRKDKYNISNVKDWVVFSKNGVIDELQWLYYDDKEIKSLPTYWPYIGIDTPYSSDIRGYEQFVRATETHSTGNGAFDYADKKNIIKFLNVMIDGILDYDFLPFGRERLHAIATNSDNKYQPLTTFGDGFQKFFRYVWTILFTGKIGDTRIMIDEIDTGVHYLKMKDQWKAIFELSRQTGTQIFATTHSMDCIKAFAEAGEEMKEITGDLRLIELEEVTIEEKTNKHIATTFNHSQLEAYLDSGINIRGGKLW